MRRTSVEFFNAWNKSFLSLTYEEKLRYNAVHDHLTDLPNRTLFFDRLGMALAQAQREAPRAGGQGILHASQNARPRMLCLVVVRL